MTYPAHSPDRPARPVITRDPLLEAVRGGVRLLELGQPFFTGMPCSPNHPGFRMTLARRHGDMVRPDGGSAANEVIVTGGHVGTHIDALSHVSHDGLLHGGVDAAAAQRGGAFSAHGAELLPGFLRRGLLFDIARRHDTDTLPGGYEVTVADLEGAAHDAGFAPEPGDVALIRTGWARHFDDPPTYLGGTTGVPGVGVPAARWLAAHGVAATGADTTAYECIAPGAGHSVLPVHRGLLVDSGIYILEHLALEELAAAELTEFVFMLAPLRIVGGTGSPVRPLAAVSR
ncbi:cyclase family protein [Nocardia otitidiscaviarum]|uniref:Cyclase family protein n=1 Tax=Nocardia otitidiscaviarum TaxID=1823 RepID=A0A516NM20_9NOCA|nr:cyclase family protein [Nocardia otitidiscaviarum]MCP9624920.1 cyclase family protein [Nocardia otitidiscaviarum]QDP79946.1 cyclase family protein [Nocardia otitidiscaviarum]